VEHAGAVFGHSCPLVPTTLTRPKPERGEPASLTIGPLAGCGLRYVTSGPGEHSTKICPGLNRRGTDARS